MNDAILEFDDKDSARKEFASACGMGYFKSESPKIYHQSQDEDDGINITGPKVLLTDYVRGLNNGKTHRPVWQTTGSCVRQGAYNALTVRAAVEVCLLQRPERWAEADTWYAYANSRATWLRDYSEGDGSSGDAIARQLENSGVIPVDSPLAAKFTDCDGVIVYDRGVEFNQSSVRNYSQEYIASCKPHSCKWISIPTSDVAVAQLRKGRPITWAGNWGGNYRCEVRDGLLFNRHADRWQHQQSCLGFWEHPRLGVIFFILNNWFMPHPDRDKSCVVEYGGPARARYVNRILKPGKCISVHSPIDHEPQFGEPVGGYWISEKDMDYQCRTGEVRSLYNFSGFDGSVGVGA